MSNDALRTENSKLQIFLNGTRLVGTKCRVRSWSMTSGITLEANEYIGEVGERLHTVYKSGQCDFTINPIRPCYKELAEFERKRSIGEASGQIDIHLTRRFATGEHEKIKMIDFYLEDPTTSGEGHQLVEERYQGKASMIMIS